MDLALLLEISVPFQANPGIGPGKCKLIMEAKWAEFQDQRRKFLDSEIAPVKLKIHFGFSHKLLTYCIDLNKYINY